jgi:hypothetical protein
LTAAYGIEVWGSDGTPHLSSDSPGTIYIGRYTAVAGSNATFNFPLVPAGYLTAYIVQRGTHSFAVGDDGSGNAQLSMTAVASLHASNTLIDVFASLTVEPDYGTSMFNAAGARMLSSTYPTPEFLAKVTFSTTPDSSTTNPHGSVTVYSFSSTITTLANGRNVVVLWNLPSWSATYMKPNGMGGASGGRRVFMNITGALPTVMPEALIFAVDGLSASSEPWGMRLYDASGNVTYDSGLNHMTTLGVEASLNFGGASYTSAFLPGSAMTIPTYLQEVWNLDGGSSSSSHGQIKEGFVRRNGADLFAGLFQTDYQVEGAPVAATYVEGVAFGANIQFVDAVRYGATYFS